MENDKCPAWPPSPRVTEDKAAADVLHQFLPCSKLHLYLAHKCSFLIKIRQHSYKLQEVMAALEKVIAQEKLFDVSNPLIVLCDDALDHAIDVKAFHLVQMRSLVLKQMAPLSKPSPCQLPGPAATVTHDALHSRQPDIPSDQLFWVTPDLLRVLRLTKSAKPSQVVFTGREIKALLEDYISERAHQFFDERNESVAVIVGDPLSAALGVQALHRHQLSSFTKMHISPYVKPKLASLSAPDAEPDRSTHEATKHCDYDSEVESIYSAQGYETVVVLDGDDFSSDNSSVSESSDIWSHSNSPITLNSNDGDPSDQSVYRSQYYLNDSTGSDDDENANAAVRRPRRRPRRTHLASSSGEDSVSENASMLLVSAKAVSSDSELADWGDNDSDEFSDDFTLSNYDPELPNGSEVWRCVNCGQPNTPLIPYCQKCWEERKGWVPPRPRQRKKRRPVAPPIKKQKKSYVPMARSNSDPGASFGDQGPVIEHRDQALQASIGSDLGYSSLRSLEASQSLEAGSQAKKRSHSTDSSSQHLEHPNADGNSGKRLCAASTDGGHLEADRSGALMSELTRSCTLGPANPSSLCNLCCMRPKDACFVHGKITHQLSCYACAREIFKRKGLCPVCRRKIEKITKNILL